jgi:hypothetical protein
MKRRDFIKLGAGFSATALAPVASARAQAKSIFKASDVQPAGYARPAGCLPHPPNKKTAGLHRRASMKDVTQHDGAPI